MKMNKEDRKEEMAAISTMFLLAFIIGCIIITTIITIFGI
jgi:hypothetical protein